MDNEVWKNIKYYFGKYKVSNMGRIMDKNGDLLSLYDHPRGYKSVSLSLCDNYRLKLVHRIVAETFIPNPENKPQINHKDGNKENNKVNNLEWVTQKENSVHASENGLLLRKKYNSNISKLQKNEVLQIRSIYEQKWVTMKEVANAYNISIQAVSKIIRRQSYKYL